MKPEQKEELLAVVVVVLGLAIMVLCYLLFDIIDDEQ